MTQPFIWIGKHKVKDAKTEELKKFLRDLPEFVRSSEPRLLAFNLYLSEEGDKVAVVQVHPDADSFEFHMKVAGEHIAQSYQYLEATESTQIYGSPSESILATIDQLRLAAGQEETLSIMAQPLGGFTRLQNG